MRRVALLAGAIAALALSLPAAGHASAPTATTVSTISLGRHFMPTLPEMRYVSSHKADCVLPVVVSVVCAGLGTPMSSGGGPIQKSPAVYIVFWGWNGRDPSGQAAYQE